jgi:hypothetical protein
MVKKRRNQIECAMNEHRHVHSLLRFGEKDHLEQFRSEGQLYMNTLEYFNRLETADAVRGDPSEGLNASHPLRSMQISISLERVGGRLPLTAVSGRLRFGDTRAAEINVFCLYAVTGKKNMVVDDRMLKFGGDAAVIILDVPEFVRRVHKALDTRGWPYESALIDYVDKESHSGPMGPFREYADRNYESEFRIAVHSKLKRPIDELKIGDLSDITQIGNARDFCSRYEIETCSDGPGVHFVSFGADVN